MSKKLTWLLVVPTGSRLGTVAKETVFVRALEGTYGELMSSCLISRGSTYA